MGFWEGFWAAPPHWLGVAVGVAPGCRGVMLGVAPTAPVLGVAKLRGVAPIGVFMPALRIAMFCCASLMASGSLDLIACRMQGMLGSYKSGSIHFQRQRYPRKEEQIAQGSQIPPGEKLRTCHTIPLPLVLETFQNSYENSPKPEYVYATPCLTPAETHVWALDTSLTSIHSSLF